MYDTAPASCYYSNGFIIGPRTKHHSPELTPLRRPAWPGQTSENTRIVQIEAWSPAMDPDMK